MVVIADSPYETYEVGLPAWSTVPVGKLTPEDVDKELLEGLMFFIDDMFGPYVMRDSERARQAVEERLR